MGCSNVVWFDPVEIAMKQATFIEVRNHAKQYFDRVEAGETVWVLRNKASTSLFRDTRGCGYPVLPQVAGFPHSRE